MKEGQLIDLYIKLRDRRAQRKKAYEADDEGDKRYQDKIEQIFLAKFNAEGTDTLTVRDVGTAYKVTKTSASVADWDALLGFVRQYDLWHLLTRGVSKSAVDEYVKANEELPPGVNMSRMNTVNVRRS